MDKLESITRGDSIPEINFTLESIDSVAGWSATASFFDNQGNNPVEINLDDSVAVESGNLVFKGHLTSTNSMLLVANSYKVSFKAINPTANDTSIEDIYSIDIKDNLQD
jgi:hypothetical protein